MGADSVRLLAAIPQLVHVSDDQPGWSRRRHGRGFRYFREDGKPITNKLIRNRLKSLAIPPAWTSVWICPLENGHLLSTGRDEAGRKQYRYHPDWMAYQQLNKFRQLVDFASQLPKARQKIRDLITDRSQGWNQDRVAALAVAIMDETGMRVGNASYRQRNGTIGLTTLRRKHVETDDDTLHFEYVGKSGIDRAVDLEDPTLVKLVKNVSELPGYELLRYRSEDGRMHNLDSQDVNELVKKLAGPAYSSKYFRTWAGTAAAVAEYWRLQEESQGTLPDRPDLRVTERVAEFLGNTVAVCRKYYIHPAVMAGIVETTLPAATDITKAELHQFGDEFSAGEIIAYRVCS
ncbi:DNA topoisomerase IB [Neolewinella persica]|uniref:DNA topoisomerase IB n=1 Tax=Neolewinella persica TaxID=70998 RepID=UPI00037C5307|nr:DNA topoisomerase IB [Neolewinella persica]